MSEDREYHIYLLYIFIQKRLLPYSHQVQESIELHTCNLMPPCVPSARLLATLKASIYSKQFICAFCIARRPLGNASKPFLRRPWMRFVVPSTARSASQIASVTAVNAQKSIPAEHKELHNALTALEGSAAVYTNLSQLQLALRGLESRDSVTRVAGA